MSRTTRTAALAVAFLVTAPGAVALAGSATAAPTGTKFFVCKYVTTPGAGEILQTGQNPISVSSNALPDGTNVGASFSDQQGRSYVLVEDTGQAEPAVSDCPAPVGAPKPVTPANPTFTDACATATDTVTIPATAGVRYKLNGTLTAAGTYPATATATVTVTALAQSGFSLTGTRAWTTTFTNEACASTTPVVRPQVVVVVPPAKVTPAKATPANVTPANLTPAKVTPAKVTPAKVTPATAATAKVAAPVKVAAAATPASGAPHTGNSGAADPLNGLVALGLLGAGGALLTLRSRRDAGAHRA